jgi:hypothetical protein
MLSVTYFWMTRCITVTARMVDSNGLGKLGIEHSREKMVGRGVLLDIARYKGVEYLPDGYGISNNDLDATAKAQKVEFRDLSHRPDGTLPQGKELGMRAATPPD